MKLNKLLKNNTFLVNSCICLVVLLAICYLGISSPIKKTYSTSTCEGTEVITEDGTTVCLGAGGTVNTTNTLYGVYKWKEEISYPSWSYDITINANFISGNVNYTGLKFSNTVFPKFTLYYLDGTGASSIYKYTAITDTWSYGDEGSEAKMTMNFMTPQEIPASSDRNYYEWFISNTEPVYNCYYNTESDSFIWSNVDVGSVKSTYNTKDKCDNARYISLDDETKSINIDGWDVTPMIFYKSKGDKFTINSILYDDLRIERRGYKFKEWNTQADGKGGSYASTAEVTLDSNLNLYAIWEPIKYTIKFDANGGTGTMENQEFTYDVSQKLTANTFEYEGYKFANWLVGEKAYSNRQQVKNLTTSDGTEIVFKAVWVALDQYTITYNANTTDTVSNMPSTGTKIAGSSASISSVIPRRSGYGFAGWYDNADCTGTEYVAGTSYTADADLVLYAKWIKPVAFDSIYTVDETNKYIIVSSPVTEIDFRKKVTLDEDYTLSVGTKKVGTVARLFTGAKATIKASDGSTFSEYTVIVLGDINGDGDITTVDTNTIYNCFIGDDKLTGIFEKAADINKSGEITTADYNTAYNYFL